MAKKKKYKIKKQKEHDEEDSSPYSRFIGNYAKSPRKERTPEQKKEYKKLVLFLFGWLILVVSVYFAFVQFENARFNKVIESGAEYKMSLMFNIVLYVYLGLGVALFLVWLIFNGGFKKVDVTKYEKPVEMGYDEFCGFIDKIKERQRKAKYFLILFLPFFIALLIDLLGIVWGKKS